ncbi:MAG: hypothetical protein FJ151_00255 [Euryarchaeota archaeon]|nr:hypothetical protein [Euryarchaeota archaeon]
MPLLLRMMLKEEYRMHVTYSSRTIFTALPLFICLVSFVVGISMPNLQRSVAIGELLSLTHVGIFLYGLSVGAFGFLGRTYVERRYGKNNFLIATPTILPLSFRSTFLGMFLRDLIFYISLVLLPAFLGLVLAAPIAHFSIISIILVFLALLLSFLFGISLSFAVSIVYTRSVKAFTFIVLAFIGLVIGYGAFGFYGLELILPPLGFQFGVPPVSAVGFSAPAFIIASVSEIAVFVLVAASLVKESYEGTASRFQETLPRYFHGFRFARSYQPLLAKEFVDIVRSGTLGKMTFSFVAPLVFLSFTTWYVNNGLAIPVGFNTVFYAGMVGFFGVLLYSWLTNLDLMDYYETVPVTVPKVIKAKLLAFFLVSIWISTSFVLAIAWINGETRLLWLALPVLYITAIYMVLATAYLTGLSPSSFLFNPEILVKFAAISILPDLGLTILSFSIDSAPLYAIAGILLVCGVLVACAFLFYRGIEEKWGSAGFP